MEPAVPLPDRHFAKNAIHQISGSASRVDAFTLQSGLVLQSAITVRYFLRTRVNAGKGSRGTCRLPQAERPCTPTFSHAVGVHRRSSASYKIRHRIYGIVYLECAPSFTASNSACYTYPLFYQCVMKRNDVNGCGVYGQNPHPARSAANNCD
jgi:hypothetical protein